MHRIESIECGRIRHTWMSDADSSTDPVLFLIAQNQVFFIPSMHWNSETNNCLSTIWNTVHTAQRLVRCRIGSTVNFDTHMLAMQQNHRFKHAFRCKVWSTMSPVSIYGMVTIVQHACQAVGVTAKARQSFKCIELIISIDLNQFAHWYFVLQSNDMPMDLIQLKLMPLGCTWNLSNSKISFQRYLSSIEILFTISPVCYQHSSQPKICVCSINKSILDFVRITINPFQF